MSSYHISLIPEDPFFVPHKQARDKAEHLLRTLVEDNCQADFPEPEVEVTITDGPQFVTCMGNFESIHCPVCDTELNTVWWQARMNDDFDGGAFKQFTRLRTPCCGAEADLNSLRYNLPQGFADYPEEIILELQSLLGCKLRQIFVRI